MQRNLLKKLIAGNWVILLVAGIMVLSGCRRYSEGERWVLCHDNAAKNIDKFAAKNGKDLDLYKVIGKFRSNPGDNLLYIYYSSKQGPGTDFMVELDLKTCKPRFSDRLKPEIPEIIEIANKYMAERGKYLSLYKTPYMGEGTKDWDVLYSKIRPMQEDSLMVYIDKKTHKTTLWGHHWEIPDPKKTRGTLKTSGVRGS